MERSEDEVKVFDPIVVAGVESVFIIMIRFHKSTCSFQVDVSDEREERFDVVGNNREDRKVGDGFCFNPFLVVPNISCCNW